MSTQKLVIPMAVLLTAAVSAQSLAPGPLARARASYAAAAYEECVEALEGAEVPRAQLAQAGEYRALCLLALDRQREAADALETVIRAVPTYEVPANSSPRLKTLVGTVRRSILPSVVQREYAAAKRAYDARELERAADGFSLVLKLVEAPEIASAPELRASDYATLASGFLELVSAARTAAAAPPAAPAEAPIFSARDGEVTPPIAVAQVIPKWNRPASTTAQRFRGLLEVVIGMDGQVESAVLVNPIHPSYDEVLLHAARDWTYEPARLNGEPVRFRKVFAINLEPH